MEKKKILLVEDEEHLLKIIQLNLELENYEVTTAVNGIDALKEFRKGSFDVILLDVMLPELNGFDVCEVIRSENARVPIMFLTAKGASADRIQGLKLGADDYLVKPFNLEELLLRVDILIRRSNPEPNKPEDILTYSFGGFQINFVTFQVTDEAGKITDITKKEIGLLKLLIQRKGEVVSREEILDVVWGVDAYPSSRTIDNYILAFRKLFEKDQKDPQHFHSIRGVGYKYTD